MRTHVAFTVNKNNKQHPGARAIEPSANDAYTPRGKLYIVVELFPLPSATGKDPSGGSRYRAADIAHVNQQVLDSVRDTYYTENGSLSQVVRAAISQSHLGLSQINSLRPDAPFGAGVCVAALLGNRLAIASCGPIISMLASGDSIQQFPLEVSGREHGIGGSQHPLIQICQHDWNLGGSLFLGSPQWLTYISQRELLGAVTHLTPAESQSIAANVSQQSSFAAIPGLFLAVEEQAADRSPFTQQQTAQSLRTAGGLPTAVHATTHGQQSQPQQSRRVSSDPATTPSLPQQDFQPQPSSTRVQQVEPSPSNLAAVPENRASRELPKYRPDHDRSRKSSTVGESIQKQPSFINRIGLALDRVLEPPTAEPVESSQARESRSRENQLKENQVNQEQVGKRRGNPKREQKESTHAKSHRTPMMSEAEYASSKGWNDIPAAKPLYIEPKPAEGRRTRLFLLLAALIVFLVPLIVLASVMSQGVSSRARAESLIDAAALQIENAESALSSGDDAVARAELTKAEKYLIDAEALKGDRNRISQLKTRAQQNLQSVLQIAPFYMLVEPLARFPSDASPSRVMIVNQDIYILDKGRNHIQRLRLDANGETVPNPEGDIILRQGDQIDGAEVGPLIDMAWQAPSVGSEEKSNLIVLDSNNQVFRFNQIVDGPSRLEFGGQELWQSPSQIQSYVGRFYIVDSGRGQIYRYSSGNFNAEPDEWLDSPAQQSLAGVLSMSIDGDIWMLFSNGELVRYQNGLAQPFSLERDVGQITNPVDMYIGDQEDSLIYLADAGADRILVFNKEGAYLRQHQAAEGAPLRDLRGIFVDEITGKIYLLTKSSLYQHTLTE